MGSDRMNGHRGDRHHHQATLWLDSRELLDNNERDLAQDDLGAFSRLLREQACKIKRNNKYITPSPAVHRFKPNHPAESHEPVPVFGRNERSPISRRNLAAESILKLQEKLMIHLERVADMDERVFRMGQRQHLCKCVKLDSHHKTSRETRLANEICLLTDANADKESPWSDALYRALWFAWPIILLSALDKYWPRVD
jgi:hypothetical protein